MTPAPQETPAVIVAGAGLTGLSAAISAREAGARVLLLEKGGREDVGGNAAFSGGLFLFCAGVCIIFTGHWVDRRGPNGREPMDTGTVLKWLAIAAAVSLVTLPIVRHPFVLARGIVDHAKDAEND